MYNQGAKGYQETLLVDTLDRIRRNPEGRKLVHLRLSQLLPQNRTPVKLKIVTRMFRTLESGRQVQIFGLTNDDLAMVVSGGAQRDVNNIVHRIRGLFDGDPATTDDANGEDRFATWYDLGLDAALALHFAQQMRQAAVSGQLQQSQAQQLPPLTPAMLDEVQKKLAFANIVPFVRDQLALRVNPATNQAAIEFCEFFLSVGDLQKAAAPNINLLGDRWLFQDLSRTMDLRMLETVIRAPHARETPALSLNLNLETIATPAFGMFLERLDKTQKVIVEIQPIDLLSNIQLYLDAHGALTTLGHSILIDGLTTSMLQMLDVAKMKPDYAKLVWTSEMVEMMDAADTKSLAFMIAEIGADKIVLSRCDSADALQWGIKAGISCFQGRFLDAFGRPGRKRARPA